MRARKCPPPHSLSCCGFTLSYRKFPTLAHRGHGPPTSALPQPPRILNGPFKPTPYLNGQAPRVTRIILLPLAAARLTRVARDSDFPLSARFLGAPDSWVRRQTPSLLPFAGWHEKVTAVGRHWAPVIQHCLRVLIAEVAQWDGMCHTPR